MTMTRPSDISPEIAARSPYNCAWLRFAWSKWLSAYSAGGWVVDLGSGIGVNATIVRTFAGSRVIAVDLDEDAPARRRPRARRCPIRRGAPALRSACADIALLIP
jgi:predicted RNA methylase